MKKSLLLASLAAIASQATAVPAPTEAPVLDVPPDDAAALAYMATLDNHVRKSKVSAVVHAWQQLRRLLKVRQPLGEAHGKNRKEWYFDGDGHYIDVVKDELGKYSVFFRDRSDKSEGWFDQAEPALNPESLRKLFEDKYAHAVIEKGFAWRDQNGDYRSAPLQHAWLIWQQAYVAMSNRIAPPALQWTKLTVEAPPEGAHIIWRSIERPNVTGIGHYYKEDASVWEGEWIAVSELEKLPTKETK